MWRSRLGLGNSITALLLALIVFLPAKAFGQADVEGYEITFPSMGTLVSLQTFSDDTQLVETVFEEAQSEIDRLVQIFSDYAESSEARTICQPANVSRWQKVSAEMWEVLLISDQWNRLSDGAFDASIGQLSILWRKARKQNKIPSQAEIDAARQLCGWQHVELDHESHAIKITLEGLRLDFGAVAKGYIIEKAFQFLSTRGLSRSMVRAGGDLRCGDPPPDRAGWKIEIANIDGSDDKPSRFWLTNGAVSSSGDLHQFIEINGKRRSHVLDPKTGIGVEGPMMVTVVTTNATEADVSDTTICILGHEAGMELCKKRPDLKVRIVSRLNDSDETQPTGNQQTGNQMRVSQHGFDLLESIE